MAGLKKKKKEKGLDQNKAKPFERLTSNCGRPSALTGSHFYSSFNTAEKIKPMQKLQNYLRDTNAFGDKQKSLILTVVEIKSKK